MTTFIFPYQGEPSPRQPLKIGFTGTREGMTEHQKAMVRSLLEYLFWNGDDNFPMPYGTHYPQFEVVHGDCVGADEEFHQIALEHHVPIIRTRPATEFYGKPLHANCVVKYREQTPSNVKVIPMVAKPAMERNLAIVSHTDLLIACPKSRAEERRSGTWTTMRFAKAQDRTVIPCWPTPESVR